MTERRRFANVRHDLRTEMPEVWADGALLGCWLQLYVVADAAWPTAAEVPRVADDEQVDRLATMGHVYRDRDDHYTYRMPGLDRYRDGEVEAGRRAYMRRKDQRDQPAPPEPDYRPLMRAFYPDGGVPAPTPLATPLARGHEPPYLLHTDGHTDGRSAPTPAPGGASSRSDEVEPVVHNAAEMADYMAALRGQD